MKKRLLGIALGSLLFTTGSAIAADYKIDKEASMPLSISVFSIWVTAGYMAHSMISMAHLLSTRKTLLPIK